MATINVHSTDEDPGVVIHTHSVSGGFVAVSIITKHDDVRFFVKDLQAALGIARNITGRVLDISDPEQAVS